MFYPCSYGVALFLIIVHGTLFYYWLVYHSYGGEISVFSTPLMKWPTGIVLSMVGVLLLLVPYQSVGILFYYWLIYHTSVKYHFTKMAQMVNRCLINAPGCTFFVPKYRMVPCSTFG